MVKSEKIYSPQNYLELITGNCYMVSGDNDVEFIENILDGQGYCLWSYPMSEIEHIISEGLDVVLVDCMVWNEKIKEYEHVYRWFEVDDIDGEEDSNVSDSNEEDTEESGTQKYFFDVKETYIKTIAIEADSLEQAYKRLDSAYSRKEFEIDRACPNTIDFVCAQKSVEESIALGFVAAEELETFDCNHVICDSSRHPWAWICPVCGKDVAFESERCEECGTKLIF